MKREKEYWDPRKGMKELARILAKGATFEWQPISDIYDCAPLTQQDSKGLIFYLKQDYQCEVLCKDFWYIRKIPQA